MPTDKHAFRAWITRIREILNHEWDPTGSCPPDEYDRYVDRIAVMICEGASDDELIQYLEWAESDYMGLGRSNNERARQVIVSLKELGQPNSDTRSTNFGH
jgi:hypothetical protein